jgi:NAD(P)-dependent dehydrogenase (short-subunit alcohol dehydrogenase family)
MVCDVNKKILKSFSNNNPEIYAYHADVSNESDVHSFFKDIKSKFNSIDVLINNAGISGPSGKLEDIDFDKWEETLNVNLNGLFLVTRSAIPLLKDKGGSIINIGSTSSFLGNPLRSAYSATKWGLIGLTKTWAMEYGENNIRVNAVCPCSVNGERIENVIEKEAEYRNTTSEKIKSAYLEQTSLKTFIDVEEVIGMLVYLISPLAKKITGQMLVIDGNTESLSMKYMD